ncbi:MAG: DUF58 domain-containing protein [Rubricoccaceae bacterium]|nr:DUF58 domain-containing protein [Rubricoccaceae bacterium]
MRFFRSLYLSKRFFGGIAGLAGLCVVGYWLPVVFQTAQVGVGVFVAAALADAVLRWGRGGLDGERDVPPQLSNGDLNVIRLTVQSRYRFPVRVRVLDEVPVQFQVRDGGSVERLGPGEAKRLRYTLRPTERGAYRFGALNLYAASPLGLLLRRFWAAEAAEAAVYPSILQMHRFAFLATSNRLEEVGVKKVRRVGQTMEFDQIRAYVPGDDRRTVNWKATARRSGGPGGLHLMVNQYEEERAQPVYAVLDMGRTMRAPFGGLTLLDHAVNASLVLLNIALQKGDKAGLVAFNEGVRATLPASRRRGQLGRLLEALYRLDTTFLDPSFEALLATMEHAVRQRGLVLLFTNFETRSGMRRQLPYLRRIARRHRLVVVFFENTGLRALLDRPARREEDVYVKAFAEGLEVEKREIARELERHGIGALLTTPEALTVDAINRYVQLKARGPF